MYALIDSAIGTNREKRSFARDYYDYPNNYLRSFGDGPANKAGPDRSNSYSICAFSYASYIDAYNRHRVPFSRSSSEALTSIDGTINSPEGTKGDIVQVIAIKKVDIAFCARQFSGIIAIIALFVTF